MTKSDFNLEDYLIEDSLSEQLDMLNEAYLICFCEDGEYIISEVHEGGYYVGGDGCEFVNDSNLGFDTPEQVKSYYDSEYVDYIVFAEEYTRDEFIENEID